MKKIYQIIFGIMAAILVATCADDKELATELLQTNGGTMITVDATMPGGKSVSKVGLAQESGSFNVTTLWQYDDEIQLFAYQDGKSYSIGKVYVSNITSDNKSCSFSFQLPEGINPQKAYNVFGLCGIEGTLDNGVITIDAPMKRVPLSLLKAPCYFATQATSTNITANFKYIGTYEILHIANYTENTISFAHNGYTTESTWFNSGMRNTLQCSNASGAMSYSGTTTTPTVQDVDIASGETASIVSWYYPNGNTITNATLNATINGSNVQSSNTKSSNSVIQNGKAYHLYAIWNGKTLKFSDRNMEEEPDPQPQYDYIDLGLPSGTLWATCNVGAQNPWDDGDYFAWGEVTTKDYYDWDTYKYCKGSEKTMTKYCNQSDYGYNGFTDNLTVLESQDDAATVNMGSEWRMPTEAEFYELISECDWEWTNNYNGMGVAGRIVKSKKNSNHIFISAIGFGGYYWTSSLYTPCIACGMYYTEEVVYKSVGYERCYRRQVRAVRVEKAAPAKVEIEMSLPSSTMVEGDEQYVYCKVNRNCGIIFYIDDNQACTESPGTPKGFYWQLYAYGPGTHTLTARAYIDGVVVAEKSLTYTVEAKPQPISTDYVDLGLPSGTLWATCNVGAKNPWDYGDYFAWGEVTTKEVYNWDTYTAGDAASTLDAAHDAATVNMGSNWRMPTEEEFQELFDNCEWEWTSDYNGKGVSGYVAKSRRSSSSIFLPAAGRRYNDEVIWAGAAGYYCSSKSKNREYTLDTSFLYLDSDIVDVDVINCFFGLSVRAVLCR